VIRTSTTWPGVSRRPRPRPRRHRLSAGRPLRALRHHPGTRWLAASALVVIGLVVLPAALRSVNGSPTPVQSVVVASRDLPEGTVITQADLASSATSSVLADQAVADPVGRTVIADIFEGEPIVRRRTSPDNLRGPTALMPAGTSAIAVPIVGALPPLAIGDLVDVYDTQVGLLGGGQVETQRPVTVGATVVAVDEERVTVAVASDDVAAVATAAGNGAATLALRPPSIRSSAQAQGQGQEYHDAENNPVENER
jgi:Flp pilus assembly protein CpaB